MIFVRVSFHSGKFFEVSELFHQLMLTTIEKHFVHFSQVCFYKPCPLTVILIKAFGLLKSKLIFMMV